LKQYLQIDITVIKIDVNASKLQGYARMLNTCGNGELNKLLTAWLCCAPDSPIVDYYLCQHCENYAAMKKTGKIPPSEWDGTILERTIDSNQLCRAFLNLLPDQRMVIYLKIVRGFSNQDVAEALSKSIGAVKAIQNRGLLNMLHLLFPERELVTI